MGAKILVWYLACGLLHVMPPTPSFFLFILLERLCFDQNVFVLIFFDRFILQYSCTLCYRPKNSTNLLTCFHKIPTFNDSAKNTLLKTLRKKEKMLVTTIFSFFCNVFYPPRKEFLFLS